MSTIANNAIVFKEENRRFEQFSVSLQILIKREQFKLGVLVAKFIKLASGIDIQNSLIITCIVFPDIHNKGKALIDRCDIDTQGCRFIARSLSP